jgi:hypothetical protein
MVASFLLTRGPAGSDKTYLAPLDSNARKRVSDWTHLSSLHPPVSTYTSQLKMDIQALLPDVVKDIVNPGVTRIASEDIHSTFGSSSIGKQYMHETRAPR